jgi:diketogulonate reductase-like aldo/keto reductase
VSNFGIHHLDELEQYIQSGGGGKIEVGQYELHPWLARSDLINWLRKRGTTIEAYSPLARGTRMDEPVLKKLSEKHNKSPAQILIRWSLQKVRKEHTVLLSNVSCSNNTNI